MRRRRLWLEMGIIVAGIALLAAWTRPRIEPQTVAATPCPQPTQGLRFLGTNAKGFDEYENLKDGTVLIHIPGGTFTMGSMEGEDDEKPPHRVTLPAYFMSRVPVTNDQFARFVAASGYDPESGWRSYASKWGAQAPVVQMSWDAAMAYCAWAGMRLPTEEEWELAARGPRGFTYPWATGWDPSRCKNAVGTGYLGPVALVGSYPSGASPFGCLDMAGNVWQWTSSCYDPYPGNTISHRNFDPESRVVRGGSMLCTSPTFFRGSYRFGSPPVDYHNDNGFRCARTP